MAAPSFPYQGVEHIRGRLRVATAPTGRSTGLPERIRRAEWFPFNGVGRVAGTVKVLTTNAPNRTVRLYDRRSGLLAFETVSATDGTYSFPSVFGGRQYYAIALDTQPGGYNATIEDLVVPA